MMQVGTNQSTTYHSQPSISTTGGQAGRSSSTSRQQQQQQQQQPQYDSEQLANIRPRLCILRKWPHYDGYGVHLARNQHWLGLRIGDVEPNSPAESGGLLREDVVLAVNGHSVENDDFFVILSFIQHELEDDQIRFLVLDPHSADLARRHRLNIDENYRTCVRMETPTLTVSAEKLLYDQWRSTNAVDPVMAQNTIHLGPTLSLNQQQASTQRYQQPQAQDGRDDVYTFLPYSDHAVENGKSFFDILFEQDKSSSTPQQQEQPPPTTTKKTLQFPTRTTQESTGSHDDDDEQHDEDDDDDDTNKEKRRRSQIKNNVKDFLKSGLDNIKSVLPTRHHDQTEKSESSDAKHKNTTDSPSYVNQEISKSNTSNSPTNTSAQEKQLRSYERLWDTSSQDGDVPRSNLPSQARICSLTLRPGLDTIGISIQPDKDFGHLIKQVEPNSLADRAGIEKDDCIISLNDIPLLNIPYDDVLNTLKRSRNEPNLEFVVCKKSYLLKSRQNPDSTGIAAEVLPSSNISGRNNTTSIPPTQALEQLYNKYNNNDRKSSFDEQTPSKRTQETVSTTTVNERYGRVSPPSENDRYPSKQQGQILQGVGPATADRSSWGVSGGKSNEDLSAPISGDASIRSTSRDRQPDTEDTKGRTGSLEEAFKPLQVGITNPTASQQSGNVSPNTSSSPVVGDNQRTSRPTSASQQRDVSSRSASIPDTAITNNQTNTTSPPSSKQNQTVQNLSNTVPIVPVQSSSTTRDYEQESIQTTPSIQSDLRLGIGGPTSMSIPSNSNRNNVPINVYEDTDDDLSDISEKSREEDTSDPIVNKTSQSTLAASILDKKDKPSSESFQTVTSGVFTPGSTLNSTDKTPSEGRPLTSTNLDADQLENASSPIVKQTIKARRLEHSDSEDTTSASDSQLNRQSGVDAFYSPDESVDDGNDDDNQETLSSRPQQQQQQQQQQQIKTNQVKPTDEKSKQQQNADDTQEDEDESNSDTSSTESQNTPVPTGKMALATMPLSEFKNHGYELHEIQLMQPTETSPVGLKLTKQQDPLQYIITAVAKDTKADLAGLKVNDWLIKVEDNDVRLVEFSEVSQEIRQLLTNSGLINMVIARKKTPSSSPSLKSTEKQQTTSSRSDSISRQQGGPSQKSVLTTDITRDTPDNSQVRFIPEKSTSPSTVRSQRSPIPNREGNVNAPNGSLSVGLTNPISDESASKSPRSQSRSPTREYTVNQQQKTILNEQKSDEYDSSDVREIVLKEALGLDFNSFIPEGDSQVQTHFISNVQASSMAERAGLRDGDRILTVNGVDVTSAIHEEVRRMMQSKKPLQLTVVNDPKYLELIENVKRTATKTEDSTTRSLAPVKAPSSDSGSDLNAHQQKSSSPQSVPEDLKKYMHNLFTDDDGTVQIKHCLLKKDPTYNGYGLLLRYQNGLHLIDQVEEDSPAYNAGLREDDVILYVDKKNVEQMTHDDVKILIRSLSLSNTNIDLVLMKKIDIPRYRSYQKQNTIDWQPILQGQVPTTTIQTEQRESSVTRPTEDSTTVPRKTSSTSSSSKQPAPLPPTAPQANTIPGTRICTLYPSTDRTAGFALSGKSPPPYIICQIEKNSPAEKAGLLINDALLSINGKTVTDKTYEETVKLIKEALQQKSVELLVRDPSSSTAPSNDRTKTGSQLSTQDPSKSSMASYDSNNPKNTDSFGDEPSHQGTNAVEEYQKQRNKELSYSLRLCHLHPTNGDGTQAATFGFELSEEPDYEYPIILRVEPQSPAEGAGLQSRDILLKINERKTKGLGYEKVKKEIEKAKRDGRLEMLVVDQETFEYCKRAKKPMKEPEMKVKHIFPKSRSSASFHKLPIAAASRDSIEQLQNSGIKNDDSLPNYSQTSVGYRLSTPKETDSENEDDSPPSSLRKKSSVASSSPQNKSTRSTQPGVNFHIETPSSTPPDHVSAHSHEAPLKFLDPAQVKANQSGAAASLGTQSVPQTSRSTPALNQTSAKDSKSSKSKVLPKPISSFFSKIGHSKSSKPDHETSSKATTSTKARAPSPPTIRVGHNRIDVPRVSQSLDTAAPVSSINDTVRSTISTGSFDYLRGPRRCVLKVDRNKGLGFVLSATGDYDHTITAVEKDSSADNAGLQVNDEVLEVDGVDVRNVKYEQVVEMLVSAMRTNETIEMSVIDGNAREAYTSQTDADKQANPNSLLNSNNNNNITVTSTSRSQRTTAVSGDDLSDFNSSISAFDSLNQQKMNTSYPNLPGQLKHLDNVTNRALSGSVPALATGITASPNVFNQLKSISTSSERGSVTKLSDISSQDAPVARLCRVRKFANSPFYGFFLCGDPKKLGRVFISDVTKHSPAAVCGLRDGDRIVEINGTTIDTWTYETILNKIKEHMARDDLELLVLDKKSLHWYRERNYPITSRTLPTIVHMEPIINDGTSEIQTSEVPTTHTKLVGFADRRVSKTGL